MLNYISAELWRMTRRWQSRLGWGIYLVLVALMALLSGFESLAQAMEAFRDLLLVGLYLVFPLAAMVDEDIWKSGVLRNEVSWGRPRSQIYLGKLLAALIAGLVLLTLTLLVFLGVALVLTGGRPDPALGAAWTQLWRELSISLPRYVGALALAHVLLFSLRPSGLGAALYYVYITFVELILGAMSLQNIGSLGDALNVVSDAVWALLLTRPYLTYGNAGVPLPLPLPGIAESWVTGGVWLVVTGAVGMAVFSRREVK